MFVDGLQDWLKHVGGNLLSFKLGLQKVALFSRRRGTQDQAIYRHAPRGEDRDETAFAVSDHSRAREFAAVAEIIHERDGIVDKILEAEILRLAEFLLPSACAALVIAERCDVARCQLLGELLQRGGFDLRSIAVVIGRSRSCDQKRDDRPFDIRWRRQYGIDIADTNRGFLAAGDHRCAEKLADCERADERVNAHAQSIFLASSGSMIGIPSRIG